MKHVVKERFFGWMYLRTDMSFILVEEPFNVTAQGTISINNITN